MDWDKICFSILFGLLLALASVFMLLFLSVVLLAVLKYPALMLFLIPWGFAAWAIYRSVP